MHHLYRSIQFTLVILLLFGCAKKEIYTFAQPSGDFDRDAKVANIEQIEKATLKPSKTFGSINLVKKEVLIFRANLKNNLFPRPEELTIATKRNNYSNTNAVKPALSSNKIIPKIFKPLSTVKKIDKESPGGKPTHKLANLGLTFSILGWILALIALLSGGAALLLLLAFGLYISGFFTSKKALSLIKKAPEQFGGKGVAKAGMILAGSVLLVLVAFILYLLAFAGAFS